ncbi:MAG: M50 family metallopeptidase [Synergistaceae bacterium]|jgi:regulator of sigma E protease|nr:M50 family metallopeptidase [Synergistaceae bacterium]
MLVSFISFVIVIGICVLAHEYGHYITARLLGVQVHEFAFGMGPLVSQVKKAGPDGRTYMLWSWRLFPIGGFCRLAGMGEEDDGETVIPSMGFNEQPVWKRFFILLNGSLFNIVLAFLLTAVFLWGHGGQDMYDTKIGSMMEGYPAQHAGFQIGDRVTAVNGEPVSEWREMSNSLRAAALKGDVVFTVERNGRALTLTTPIPPRKEHGYPMLGITPAFRRYAAWEALTNAAGYIWNMTKLMLKGIWDWLSRKQEVDVTGPIGIASMSGQAMREGAWSFITFLALITLNLGLLNLFPFPALDGGRIAFLIPEVLLRRRLPERLENWVNAAGLVVLLLLMVVVTGMDLSNLYGERIEQIRSFFVSLFVD